jgi:phage shock protein A
VHQLAALRMSNRKRVSSSWKAQQEKHSKKHKKHHKEEDMDVDDAVWHYVASDGQTLGPFNVEQMKETFQNGTINESTFVWKDSFGDQWKKLKKVEELAAVVTVKPDPQIFEPETDEVEEVQVSESRDEEETVFKQEFEECQPSATGFGSNLNQEIMYESQQCYQTLQNDVDLLEEFQQTYLTAYQEQIETAIQQTFEKIARLVEAYRQQTLEKFRENMSDNLKKVEDKKKDIQTKIDMLLGVMEQTDASENPFEAHQRLLSIVEKMKSSFKPGSSVQEVISSCERLNVTSAAETFMAGNMMKFVSLNKEPLVPNNSTPEETVASLEERSAVAGITDDTSESEDQFPFCAGKLIRSYQIIRKGKRMKETPLSPRAVAFNPDTRMLYVADYDNHRVAVFGSRGGLVFCFGQGNACLEREDEDWIPGTVVFPVDLRLFKKNVFVLDKYRIQVYSHSGTILKHMNLPADGVFESFCIASNGHMFVSNLKTHRLHIFNIDGKLLKVVGTDMWNPRFTRYSEGKIFVADGASCVTRRINIFDIKGQFLERFSLNSKIEKFTRITGITVSLDHVYISEAGADRVLIFSKDGKYIGQWTIPSLSRNAYNRHAHLEWKETSKKPGHPGVVFVSDVNARMVHVYQ